MNFRVKSHHSGDGVITWYHKTMWIYYVFAALVFSSIGMQKFDELFPVAVVADQFVNVVGEWCRDTDPVDIPETRTIDKLQETCYFCQYFIIASLYFVFFLC